MPYLKSWDGRTNERTNERTDRTKLYIDMGAPPKKSQYETRNIISEKLGRTNGQTDERTGQSHI